jgi:hypothetical protein
MAERDDFLRELHHRVKNNFQIIASLMNLQKRMLPPERRGDLRLLEEHVQSMAVAYRIVSGGNELIQVPIDDLVTEVGDNLRQIAGASRGGVQYSLSQAGSEIGLTQGIVLGLYLAIVMPPHLDHVVAHGGAVRLGLSVADGEVLVSISCSPDAVVPMDYLRTRLIAAYIRQLRGDAPAAIHPGEFRLHFALEPAPAAITPQRGGIVPGGTVQAPCR